MDIPVDYETLRLIWWLLLGVLLIGFAVMDGFDLGVGTLLPFVARTDLERRVTINTIGPVWDGNQVWLILGAGAIFAAFPPIYAAAFSGFYFAMFLALVALILRPVGFDFRNKIKDARWRKAWDWALFISGFVPSLIFGVAFGNLLQGVPFTIDANFRFAYHGGLIGLLNPFALLAGLISVAMLVAHGAAYLMVKTEDPVAGRARAVLMIAAPVTAALFAVAGAWVAGGIDGYVLAAPAITDGPSHPLLSQVTRAAGAWMSNFSAHPWMWIAPALGIGGALAAALAARAWKVLPAFLGTAAAVFGIIATAGLAMFPFMMPSSVQPDASLTVWDATSSHLTLFVMLVATLIFMPIILAYTSFVFRVLRGKVTADYVTGNDKTLY